MMKANSPTLTEFVILPEVILVMVYAFMVRIWSVWVFCTLRSTGLGDHVPQHIVSRGQLIGVTLINVALLVLLSFAALRTKWSSPSLRRGHMAGLALAVIVTIFVQVGALRGFMLEGVSGASMGFFW